MRNYSFHDIDRALERFPGHSIVEVITSNGHCLVAVPPRNRKGLTHVNGAPIADLHGQTIYSRTDAR